MTCRAVAVLAIICAVAACAPEPAPEPEPTPEAAPMDDEAAIAALGAAYVENYNAGNVDEVAALFAEDAFSLPANSSVSQGREAIAAALSAGIAGNPTLRIDTADTMVMGDWAASRGSYGIEMAPEGGAPISLTGSYMTMLQRVDGDWKISLATSNYDAPPPEGVSSAAAPESRPDEMADSPLAEVTGFYADHFNMGHAAVVTRAYTEDAVTAFADAPVAEGSAAIEAALERRMQLDSPQLTIHTVGANDLGDGWVVVGGWYEIETGDGTRVGNWVVLASTAEDGSKKFHWTLTNVRHDSGDM